MFLEKLKNKLVESYEQQIYDLTGGCGKLPPEEDEEAEIIRTPGYLFRLGKNKEQETAEPN